MASSSVSKNSGRARVRRTFLTSVDVMPPTRSKTRKIVGSPVVRDALNQLKALQRRLGRRHAPKLEGSDDWRLRWNIIQEDLLRREVAADEALRTKDPELWKQKEVARLARNREIAALNQRLRNAGLRPESLRPSLKQRMKKLQRLESSNLAETARIRETR